MKEEMNNESVPQEAPVENRVAKKSKDKWDISDALLIIIAVLVVMSGIQVFQTQKLLAAVSSGTIKTSAGIAGSSVGLPSQVGGCG
ncbi:MAG: hypothetical protein BMS9Abin13_199 [Patescibacteria group bacterium]|nr:MAG: hypothetical protein BMS9Abin13_199 [Patescibacteria group bacterium]